MKNKKLEYLEGKERKKFYIIDIIETILFLIGIIVMPIWSCYMGGIYNDYTAFAGTVLFIFLSIACCNSQKYVIKKVNKNKLDSSTRNNLKNLKRVKCIILIIGVFIILVSLNSIYSYENDEGNTYWGDKVGSYHIKNKHTTRYHEIYGTRMVCYSC